MLGKLESLEYENGCESNQFCYLLSGCSSSKICLKSKRLGLGSQLELCLWLRFMIMNWSLWLRLGCVWIMTSLKTGVQIIRLQLCVTCSLKSRNLTLT